MGVATRGRELPDSAVPGLATYKLLTAQDVCLLSNCLGWAVWFPSNLSRRGV